MGISKQAGRFVQWRRKSGVWNYLLFALFWGGAAGALHAGIHRHWAAIWIGALALFVVFVELGLATFVAVAWSGHRALESEAAELEHSASRQQH